MRYPATVPFPSIANPDFLAVASDEFIAQTIRQGRPGRRMPAWHEAEGGLRDEEIAELVKYLRQLSGVAESSNTKPRHWVEADPQRGEQLFARYCAGCHGTRGEGTQAPALNNPVFLAAATDTYLVETIGRGRRGTEMPAFREASPVHPALADADIESIVAFIRQWQTANSKSTTTDR